jgi:WD40 repeat protein
LDMMFLSKLTTVLAGVLVAIGVMSAGSNSLPQMALAQQTGATQPAEQGRERPVHVVKTGAQTVSSVAYCNGGKAVAVRSGKLGAGAHSVTLWDLQQGKVAKTLADSEKDSLEYHAVTSSRDGTTIAASSDAIGASQGVIKVWDAKTGKLLRAFKMSQVIEAVALSSDGTKVAAGEYEHGHELHVWDVKSGELLKSLAVDGMNYRATAVSENGKWVVGAGYTRGQDPEGKAIIFEFKTGKVKHELTDSQMKTVLAVAISPDSKLLATGGFDGMIRLWDMESGKRKHLLKPVQKDQGELSRMLLSMAFSPDGKWLASSGVNGITLWDMTKAEARQTFGGLGEGDQPQDEKSQMSRCVKCIAFSPDGQTLASAYLDGTIRFRPIKSTGSPAQK